MEGTIQHVDYAETHIDVQSEKRSGAESAYRSQDAVERFDSFLSHGQVDWGTFVLKPCGVQERPLSVVLRFGGISV